MRCFFYFFIILEVISTFFVTVFQLLPMIVGQIFAQLSFSSNGMADRSPPVPGNEVDTF